jgi:acetyltransferase-like isoleucine patch superfamily enzyme
MTVRYLWAKLFKKAHGRAMRGSVVCSTSKVEAGSEFINSTMARHSFCGYYCEIINCDIGSFCSLSNHVVIGGGMHPMRWASTSPVFYCGRDSIRMKYSEHDRPAPLRTLIGHDVWVGERAIIKQGVTVGTGAVVGMGSVVTRDVPPYAIVAGAPARIIRDRFDKCLSQRLLASQWWNSDDATLIRAAQHVRDPEAFLKELGK